MLKKFWFETAFAQGRWGRDMNFGRSIVRTGIGTDGLLMMSPALIGLVNTERSLAFALAGSAVMLAGMGRMLMRSIIWSSASIEDMEEHFARSEGEQTVIDTVMLSGKIRTLKQASIVGRCIGSTLAHHAGDDPFMQMHEKLMAAIRGRQPEPKSFHPDFIRLCNIAVRAKLMKIKELPEPCRPDPNIIEGDYIAVESPASPPSDVPRLEQR